MAKAKRAGAELDFTTMSHYCNFQIYHSSEKARHGKECCAHSRALGVYTASPSNTRCGLNYQDVCTFQDR